MNNSLSLREKVEVIFKEFDAYLKEVEDLEKLREELKGEDHDLAKKRTDLDVFKRSLLVKEEETKREREYIERKLLEIEKRESKIQEHIKNMDRERISLSQDKNLVSEYSMKMRELSQREAVLLASEKGDQERKKILDSREKKIRELENYLSRREQLAEI